jgi:hypothetical protein
MSHPRVVHCKRAPHDVYIGRPSRWGNPYIIGHDGTALTNNGTKVPLTRGQLGSAAEASAYRGAGAG